MSELQMELIKVLITAISGVLAILLTVLLNLITKWLKDHRLYEIAEEGVNYAEQKWKTGDILTEERKNVAIAYMRARGINISDELADIIIESVVGSINIALGKTETIPDTAVGLIERIS